MPALIEGLTEAAIKRPDQPLLWLAQFVLERSPVAAAYKIVPVKYVQPHCTSTHARLKTVWVHARATGSGAP